MKKEHGPVLPNQDFQSSMGGAGFNDHSSVSRTIVSNFGYKTAFNLHNVRLSNLSTFSS